MSIPLLVFLGIACVVTLVWAALAIRLILLSQTDSFRFLKAIRAPTNGPLPSVIAIIPARNEEANLERTVDALRAQEYPNLTLTVVDDQSSDATGSILERLASTPSPQAALRWIRGSERPEGWVGKTWAVHQGASEASQEWLWFVDADMGLHPLALATAMEAARETGADFVSLLPGVRCRTFWQGAIATSFLQLLGQLYPLDRVNDPTRPEAIAAGGFILVRRTIYQQAGGHEAVRRAIVEDIQLARQIKKSGGKILVRLAPSLVWTHMYGRFGEIWKGLRKNAYAGMDYLPHKYVTGSLIALTLAWIPWIALGVGLTIGSGSAIVIGASGLIAQALAMAPIVVFLGIPFSFAFTSVAGISAYVAIATSSVWHHHRGRILWKDRLISTLTVETEIKPRA